MKAIAVIEILEGGKGKWYIDGKIRYTENESLMKKFDKEMIPLKPMPERWEGELQNTHPLSVYSQGMRDGFNMCLEEITE